jgi:pyruvate dehydrogenase E2 component (dihydrolipoamide acetyltransferase)
LELQPILKDADKKTIEEISKDIQALAQQARDRKISIADMKGQTFTITNVGSLGGVYAIPIINQPDAAILGLGKLIDRPMVVDGKIEIRKVLTVSLAFDHRIIDGADAARFMNDVVRHLNDPNLLMIENE